MFYRTLEGLLLKCLGPTEANRLLHKVHEGACGTHQSAHMMKWLIRRSGYYWPTMLEDCFKYYKGCQACQRFRKIQMVPMSVMNPIIKPRPFRGWGMDMIGKINPPVQQGSPVHFGHHRLFHQMGGGHPYEVSNTEGCYQFYQRACYSQVWDSSDHHDRWRICLHI
jgi:hypothetical protein